MALAANLLHLKLHFSSLCCSKVAGNFTIVEAALSERAEAEGETERDIIGETIKKQQSK